MTITVIDSPKELTDYFTNTACHNHVWAAFDGSAIVGWHPDKAEAQNLFKGLPLVKVYKNMKG